MPSYLLIILILQYQSKLGKLGGRMIFQGVLMSIFLGASERQNLETGEVWGGDTGNCASSKWKAEPFAWITKSVVRDRTVWVLNVYFKRAWQGWLMGHAWSWDLVVSLYIWPSDGCVLKAPGSSWSDLVSFINLREWLEGLKLIIASLWSSLYSETVPPPCMLGDILIVYGVCMWGDRELVGVSVYSW